MLNDRRKRILSALVEEYVRSAQPVASRALVDRYGLGCCSATVRNDLAVLEEDGYVLQPHVSAGRVPTDQGYRAFVDEIGQADRTGLTEAEFETIRSYYAALEREIDELMRETSIVLSRITNHVAVVLAPTLRRARLRRIDVVPMGTHRALVVVITDAGQVVSRHVELRSETTAEELVSVERLVCEMLDGKFAEDVRSQRQELLREPRPAIGLTLQVVDGILECLSEADDDQLYHGGASALLSQPEFNDPRTVQPLLGLLEDGFSMLKMLSEAVEAKDVIVRIGHENPLSELGNMSVVAVNYGGVGSEGIVGIIGPTRMDYSRAITAVRCVAGGLSEVLGP